MPKSPMDYKRLYSTCLPPYITYKLVTDLPACLLVQLSATLPPHHLQVSELHASMPAYLFAPLHDLQASDLLACLLACPPYVT